MFSNTGTRVLKCTPTAMTSTLEHQGLSEKQGTSPRLKLQDKFYQGDH